MGDRLRTGRNVRDPPDQQGHSGWAADRHDCVECRIACHSFSESLIILTALIVRVPTEAVDQQDGEASTEPLGLHQRRRRAMQQLLPERGYVNTLKPERISEELQPCWLAAGRWRVDQPLPNESIKRLPRLGLDGKRDDASSTPQERPYVVLGWMPAAGEIDL